jgi:hypothetical protein
MYDVTSGPNSSRMNTGGATDRIEEWCAALHTSVTAATTRTARLGTAPPAVMRVTTAVNTIPGG